MPTEITLIEEQEREIVQLVCDMWQSSGARHNLARELVALRAGYFRDFASACNAKMQRIVKEKGRTDNWADMFQLWILARMMEEVGELTMALATGGDVQDECLDVGAFAMMMWENARAAARERAATGTGRGGDTLRGWTDSRTRKHKRDVSLR